MKNNWKLVRLQVTKQIAYLQDNSDVDCATDTTVFACNRACASTLDGQLKALEWVSKKYVGPCKNYNFRYTKKHDDIRTLINVPKAGE